MIASAEGILAADLGSWIPDRPLPSYRAFARTMTYPTGIAKGRSMDPDADPWQSYLVDVLDDARWSRIYVGGAAQVTGKTTWLVHLPLLRNTIGCRLPVAYGLPSLKDIRKVWASKLLPGLKLAGYGSHMPVRGDGARGGVGHSLQFADPITREVEGMVLWAAAKAVGDTCAVAILDEVDSWRTKKDVPNYEGIADIFARCNSYGSSARRIAVGTLETDDPINSIILTMVNVDGTGTRMWPRCPHCQTHGVLEWEHVNVSAGRIGCVRCGALWTEPERLNALQHALFVHRGQTVTDGTIIGAEPDTGGIFGAIITALECTLCTIPELVAEWRSAQNKIDAGAAHGPMRKFYRYRLCRGYTADQEAKGLGLTWERLLSRSQSSPWGPSVGTSDRVKMEDDRIEQTYSRHICPTIPEAATYCIGGVDVQGNRIYWTLIACNDDGTTWDLGWGFENSRSDSAQHNSLELGQVLTRAEDVMRRACEQLPLALIGVDTGDDTANLMAWIRQRSTQAGSPWRPIKGVGPRALRNPQRNDIEGLAHRGTDGVILINTSACRDQVQGTYSRPAGTKGSAISPYGLTAGPSDRTYFEHLCGEIRVFEGRKDVIKSYGRHDFLDARIYAYAMMLLYIKATTGRKPQRPVPTEAGTISGPETIKPSSPFPKIMG